MYIGGKDAEKTRGCGMDKKTGSEILIGVVLKELRSAGCGGSILGKVGNQLCQV